MKKVIIVLIICVVISLICLGCVQKTGFIMRNDITYKDLEFVYDGNELNSDVTIDDMYSIMGLPNIKTTPKDADTSGMRYYSYYFDDEVFELGVITFTFDNQLQFVGAPIDSYPSINIDIEPFEIESVVIDRDKYKMDMRDDIEENELEFIDMESTSVDVQQALGAPHDRIGVRKIGLRTDAYTYPMTNGNTFIISYERNGVIVKAWVVDENKETQKVYVDRTVEFGVWEDILGAKLDDVEYK